MNSQRPSRKYDSQTALVERVETLQARLEQVERTLSAVAREASGISVAGPCTECQRSLLFVRDGELICPTCGYRRSL